MLHISVLFFLILRLLDGVGFVKGQKIEEKTCVKALGVPKDPCPPCSKQSYAYLTSDVIVDQAVSLPDPSWYRCLQRKETAFSAFGSTEEDFDTVWAQKIAAHNTPPYNLDVTILFQPSVPCDVQVIRCPQEKVIGCDEKLMMAHEDAYRRQCKEKYVNNFKYTLKKAEYDSDLAAFWLEHDPDFVRQESNGDLSITYDYTTFGCPVEPYQEDYFAPDLRILTQDMNRNTSLGAKYNGSYILIEIFGAKGYLNPKKGYSFDPEKPKDFCSYKPQTLKGMVKKWKRQVRNRPKTKSRDPQLIWNFKNYITCNDTNQKGNWKPGKYEIMNNKVYDKDSETNRIIWNTANDRPQTFIFLAMALDDENDCEYYALFGVSLPKAKELDSLISLYLFIIFTLLLILLVIGGYYCRKAQIRRQYFEEARAERLKQSAWAVIYRYEKLLHESENKPIDKEMSDFYSRKRKSKGKNRKEETPTEENPEDNKETNSSKTK